MIDIVERSQLEFLAQTRPHPCVSIFLPTHRAGPEIRQDPIRLKNLIRQAESHLAGLGLRPTNIREILAPARDLVRRNAFWRWQGDGLALFLAGGFFQYFRLPLEFQELVAVSDRFEVSPLLPLFTAAGRFYLLALSRNRVALFGGTPYFLAEMGLAGVPRSLDEALKYDVRDSQLQVHSGVRLRMAARGAAAKQGAVFTGQGVGVDDEESRTLEFVHAVERGMRRSLRDQQAPLVLAGVEELLAVYRSANKYPRLLERGVPGNPDFLKEDELHKAAWDIVGPYFDEDCKRALVAYQNLKGSGRSSGDLHEILLAAYQGRIQSAFLAAGVHLWGDFDFEADIMQLHDEYQPGDEDLLNLIAIQTTLHQGTTYVLRPKDMPDGLQVAATLRY